MMQQVQIMEQALEPVDPEKALLKQTIKILREKVERLEQEITTLRRHVADLQPLARELIDNGF